MNGPSILACPVTSIFKIMYVKSDLFSWPCNYPSSSHHFLLQGLLSVSNFHSCFPSLYTSHSPWGQIGSLLYQNHPRHTWSNPKLTPWSGRSCVFRHLFPALYGPALWASSGHCLRAFEPALLSLPEVSTSYSFGFIQVPHQMTPPLRSLSWLFYLN